jgi:hypothetical protein
MTLSILFRTVPSASVMGQGSLSVLFGSPNDAIFVTRSVFLGRRLIGRSKILPRDD